MPTWPTGPGPANRSSPSSRSSTTTFVRRRRSSGSPSYPRQTSSLCRRPSTCSWGSRRRFSTRSPTPSCRDRRRWRGRGRRSPRSNVAAVVVALHARDTGSGRPVVLLHAFPLSSAMWLAQREALGSTCRVVTPDLRGFGGSPLGSDEPSVDAFADDVAALLDTLGFDRVVLGGLSMG